MMNGAPSSSKDNSINLSNQSSHQGAAPQDVSGQQPNQQPNQQLNQQPNQSPPAYFWPQPTASVNSSPIGQDSLVQPSFSQNNTSQIASQFLVTDLPVQSPVTSFPSQAQPFQAASPTNPVTSPVVSNQPIFSPNAESGTPTTGSVLERKHLEPLTFPTVGNPISSFPPSSFQAQPFQTASPASPVISSQPISSPIDTGVDMRTAQSDISSLKQSGGLETQPKTFSPSDLEKGSIPTFAVETPNQSQAVASGKSIKNKGSERKIIIGLVVLAVIGLITLAIFFVRPIIESALPIEPAPTEEITQPDLLPPAETVVPVPEHVSMFIIEPDLTETLSATGEFQESSFKDLLIMAVADKENLSDGAIKEVVLVEGESEKPISFTSLFASTLTDIDSTIIDRLFETNATFFIYFDQRGDWPGLIVKVKDGVDKETMDNFSQALEKSTKLTGFFLSSPGTIGEFKDGHIENRPVRFASFSNRGFIFDYGWFEREEGTYFMISTSYNGMKEAVRRAGF